MCVGKKGVWSQVPVASDCQLPIPRVGHASTLYFVNNQYVMLVYGGEDCNKVTLDDTWLLYINTQPTCTYYFLFFS